MVIFRLLFTEGISTEIAVVKSLLISPITSRENDDDLRDKACSIRHKTFINSDIMPI